MQNICYNLHCNDCLSTINVHYTISDAVYNLKFNINNIMICITGTKEKATVRYSYSADNEDELSLKEGETVIILDKNLEDAGWWKGELNGKVGVFPDNFVEIIPADEVKF